MEQTKNLPFETALTMLRQGKRLRRSSWATNEYLAIRDGVLCRCFGTASTAAGLNSSSIMSCDWEVAS